MRKLRLVCLVVLAACGDDGGSVAGPDAPGPPNTGAVSLSSYKTMQTTQVMGNIVNASFLFRPAPATCTSQQIGPCILSQCTVLPGQPMYVNAGTVTVTGLSQTLTLTPSSITNMYQPDNSANAFVGGETVNITGMGATAPAFTLSLTAPSLASITVPAKPSGTNPLAIDRSHDLAVAWTGGGASDIDFVFGSTSGGPSLNCAFAATAGSGTIPTAALAMLPAGSGSFSASTEVFKSVDVGEWRMFGEAFYIAVWSADMSQSSVTTMVQ
ncbi:MAG TPA: hypothetical protein VL326_20790 [Kofleriaceae bacterium]|nr:hypothetical protein [Kofleriaceae bacterium]